MTTTQNKWNKAVVSALLVVLVLGLAAALMFAAFIAGRATAPSPAPAQTAASETEAAVDGVVQEYTCSMHPQVRSPNPKDKCPICGMDLIPVPADADDGDADAPVLRLSPRAAALMQVEVWPVERRAVHREVRLFGRLAEDETRLRTIAARYPGRLDRLFVNFTGTSVVQGEPLAEIYSPEIITAQEELFQSLRAIERAGDDAPNRLARGTAHATLDAAREKLRLLGLTPTQIDQIETRRTLQEHITIHAPISGVVTQRHATEGAYVETGEPIYSIADLSHLWVNMEVYETELAWLSVGNAAVFTTQAHPGEAFTGTVAFIDPIVDAMKRTIRVRIDVPNEHGRLMPGMFVRGTVRAVVGHRPSAISNTQAESRQPRADSHMPLVIPATAPLITGRRAVVYVQVSDEERIVFEGRMVTLGPRVGGRYIVQDGLEEGELVVVHGAFKIDSELQIRGRPSMMQPEGGRAPVPGPHDHGQHGAARLPDVERMGVSASFRTALTPVYEAYVQLQVMLADDDLPRSRRAAKQLHAAVAEVQADELQGEARDMWRVIAARLRTDYEHVDHFDLDSLRTRFEIWSQAAIEMSRRFGYDGGRDLVLAYCPMAFDDAGAHWLQVGHAIANPYFGEMMFRCGEVIGHVGEHIDDEEAEDDTDAGDAPVEFIAALGSVYAAYFEVQNALAADDLDRSRRATERFHQQVRDVDAVPGDAPGAWSDLRQELLTDAARVETADIESLRELFEPWAMAMIEVSKRFGHADEGGHFIAHCPMAFEWRGASWLQAESRINNPYFGASMLRCGSIRERLEPRAAREGGNQ